jgi:hypothetical protein
MGRIAEQYGKNDLAVHLFAELGERASEVTLSDWEPELLFEVQARHLKLLRLKAGRSEADNPPYTGNGPVTCRADRRRSCPCRRALRLNPQEKK